MGLEELVNLEVLNISPAPPVSESVDGVHSHKERALTKRSRARCASYAPCRQCREVCSCHLASFRPSLTSAFLGTQSEF